MATATSPKKSSASAVPNRQPQGVKFARRTSSGRIVSLSRDDDLDISGEFAGPNDYINYTVIMPPTPDNQPGATGDKPDNPGPYGQQSRFGQDAQRSGMSRRGGGDEEGGYGGDGESGKLDRRMSVMKHNNKSMLLRSQTSDFDHNRWLFESKGKYGIGNAYWSHDDDSYDNDTGTSMADFMDKPWKPLTRKVQVPASVLSPYRCIYIFFLQSFQIYINIFIIFVLKHDASPVACVRVTHLKENHVTRVNSYYVYYRFLLFESAVTY